MTNAEIIREAVLRDGGTFDYSKVLFDKVLLKVSCDELYDMFDREVFDLVIGVGGDMGMVLASHVAVRMGRGFFPLSASNGCPSDLIKTMDGKGAVIIGDSLTDGKVQKDAVDLVEGNGGTVIKIGSLSEIEEIKARKEVLRPYPVESLMIF